MKLDFDKKIHAAMLEDLLQAQKSGEPFPMDAMTHYLCAFFNSLRRAELLDTGYLNGTKSASNSPEAAEAWLCELEKVYGMWLKHCGWLCGPRMLKVMRYHLQDTIMATHKDPLGYWVFLAYTSFCKAYREGSIHPEA